MTKNKFNNLKTGDEVTLAQRLRDYYNPKGYLEFGSKGIFVCKAPAVFGRERDFAVIDFPQGSRCGAFSGDLI